MLSSLTKRISELADLRSDLAMVLMIAAIMALMILPMPTLLVDILIGINLSIALVLLMVALHLNTPLSLSSFPALLLVSTLFRLSLAIATTRLILLQGDAGRVIETFGNFVVGGNLLVGLIVFLILTLVQFIVITKGSERVAEVGARFSLDGMPGKQMSIDGDMRAGAIDKNEAKLRRTQVETESQFYGAMDGAMKFVKGDAIAGLVIVLVNLLGGVGVAVLQRDMDLSSAMQVYSILTVGDGLVSQIPALLISVSAGIIVTRVTNRDSTTSVGKDIAGQLFSNPKALLFGGAAIGGMAALPGMPTIIFGLLGLSLGGSGAWRLFKGMRARQAGDSFQRPGTRGGGATAQPGQGAAEGGAGGAFSVPLVLSVAPGPRDRFSLAGLTSAAADARSAKSFELGVPYPEVPVRVDEQQHAHSCVVYCNEVPVAQWRLMPGMILAQGALGEHLRALGTSGVPADVVPGVAASTWVPEQHGDALKRIGIVTLPGIEALGEYLRAVLDAHAADFLGLQETCGLLSSLDSLCPDLIKEVDRAMPKPRIADVLQRLVSEGIPIRNLKGVLETLTKWGQKEKDPVVLTEYVRADMKRQISHKFTGGGNVLTAYLLAPRLEETLRGAIRQTSAGSYVVLEPHETKLLLDTVKLAVGDLKNRQVLPVLLTAMDIRRYLRKLIEQDCPELAVLAYQELTPEISVQAVGRIDLPSYR